MKKRIISYSLIFIITFLISYALFFKGFVNGDDIKFHFAQIMDDYLDLKNLNFDFISTNLGGGIGVGKRLFYSPLSHLSVAVLGILLEPLHISLMSSFKISIFLSIFLSGIFMYHLALRLTHKNELVSLIVAGVYLLFPYRLYDIYHRISIAEAFSFIFIPIFFSGLYDLTHLEGEVRFKPYLLTILGGTLLFLTHNLTAFYCYIFGIIYLLIYADKIVKNCQNKRYLIYAISAIFIFVGLISINLFTQLELMNSNFYVLTNPSYMWTSREDVVNNGKSSFIRSGFLYIPLFAKTFKAYFTQDQLFINLIIFMILSVTFVYLSSKLKEIKKLQKYYLLITIPIYLLTVFLFTNIKELIYGAFLVGIIYPFLNYFKFAEKKEKVFKNRTFYYSLLLLGILLILMEYNELWNYLPKIFLKIQFPWRLWSFVQFFFCVLLCLVLPLLDSKKLLVSFSTLALGFLFVVNRPLLQTVYRHENFLKQESKVNEIWHLNLDERYFGYSMSQGANKEYAPEIYHARSQYVPKYRNSLYYQVRDQIFINKFEERKKHHISPVFLEGHGQVEVLSFSGSKYHMNLEVMEDSLIQIPLFYYPGYQIKVNGEVLETLEVDGLVSFKVPKGSYQVETLFVGSTVRIFSYFYFSLSLILVISLGLFDYYYFQRKSFKNKVILHLYK